MEVVLIDKFIVPEEVKAKFLEEVRKSASVLRPFRVLWRDLCTRRLRGRAATMS